MTHAYTIATGGLILGAAGPTDVPRTAIAWAADRVLAAETDEVVRAISRGDSTFIDLVGCVVTPAPVDEPGAVRIVRAAVAGGRPFDPVEVLAGAGLLATDGELEPGSPADLAFWEPDPRRLHPEASALPHILATVRGGAFTRGDIHAGPFARLRGGPAGPIVTPGSPEWARLATEFNATTGTRWWLEVQRSAAYPDARDEALALWREVFDEWLRDSGHAPGSATFTEIVAALGLREDR